LEDTHAGSERVVRRAGGGVYEEEQPHDYGRGIIA